VSNDTDTAETTTDVAPLSDEAHEIADRIVRRYPVARSALLPLLHLVQSEQNHITDEGIAFCAEKVGLTRAEVGSVATFYTMYKREPVGDWLLSVCTNPPCKIAGGQEIFDNYVEELGGHRDPETKVTVEHAECLGICDGAPVVQVNYEMYGPMTVQEGSQLLAACRKGEPPESPWSGEKPPTFAEVERDLSGANDAWEAELHRAALQQIAFADPPTYRTGETDIPVTHPGGDPAGIGGAAFRQQATGNGQHTEVEPDVDPVAGDPDQSLAGDDSQRIAPGESDDPFTTAGAGTPTADEVDVHPPAAVDLDPEMPADAPGMTRGPGPGDQPGDVGVLGDETPGQPDRPGPDDFDSGDETDVASGEAAAPAQSSGVGNPEGEPEADGVLSDEDQRGATERDDAADDDEKGDE